MTREELLSVARSHIWAAWQLSSEELASQAADTLIVLGMLVEEGGAQELERLRARVAELEAKPEFERLSYAERAKRERVPARRAAWRMLAQSAESERVGDALLAVPQDAEPAGGIS